MVGTDSAMLRRPLAAAPLPSVTETVQDVAIKDVAEDCEPSSTPSKSTSTWTFLVASVKRTAFLPSTASTTLLATASRTAVAPSSYLSVTLKVVAPPLP